MAQKTQQLLQSLLVAFDLSTIGTNIQEDVLRILSDDSSGRTNQFEVQARLNGLVEKSLILNNSALADALQLRLDELSKVSTSWTPDILAFLLELSDRPVHKTRVEDLVSLGPDPPAPPLTWEAIIEEDPLEDYTAVWRDVDFAADDSDEDAESVSQQFETREDEESCGVPETEDTEADLESLIVATDKEALEEISAAQAWRAIAAQRLEHRSADDDDAFEIMEIDGVREIIFMLLGLPTSMFKKDEKGALRLQQQVRFGHTSPESVMHLLKALLELGQKLSVIRRWLERKHDVPLEQAFQSALETRLQVFNSTLHDIQKRTLDHSNPVVVSIIDVCNEVITSSRLIMQLHDVLNRIMPISESQRPFRILEILYNQTCTNQKVGDDEGYEYMARIFFRCFQIYLKPVQAWMETGEADSHNRVMFINKNTKSVPSYSIWEDQYHLLHNADGTLKAPQFLHVAGKKIFNTGKSVDFLKKLGVDNLMQTTQPHNESLMSYEAVCIAFDPRNFVPFPELFDAAFARWISSRHRSSSALLRKQLESQCGLKRALLALNHIYLYYNGALSNNAVHPLFEKIERGKRPWNDSFTMSELFHDAFVAIDCIDLDRLSIRPTASKHASNIKGRSMDVLEKFHILYMLPWPVANIIKSESMATYQRIFVLLTQLERARFLLQRNKLPAIASKKVYAVHTHLLWFVNTLFSHLTTLVIAVNTDFMHQEMADAEDVDAMIAVHRAYIAKLEDQCLLAKQHNSLRRAVVAILDLTVLYSDLQLPSASKSHTLGHSASASSSEDDEEDTSHPLDKPVNDTESRPSEQIASIHGTYSQLLAIVTASVEGISKADGGTMWTILATHLAFGVVS